MRGWGLVPAVGIVAAGLVGVPGTAQAAPAATAPVCRFGVPAKLTITAPDTMVDFGYGAACPKTMVDATWMGRAEGIDGSSYTVHCTWGNPPCGFVVDLSYPGHTMHWIPQGYGKDANGRKVAELRSATSITKYGAAVKLTAGRVGTKTTLSARPTYYSAKTKGFVRHHGRVLFQSKDPGSSTWKDLGYVVPNSTGAAVYTITTNRSRAYRAYVASSATVWYAYSAPVTK
ncbi:hypothetical protein GCM10029976_043690 [Kribbella albertanoniae]|uniref:Uncharacterized protein n=1 Tax=Kribbella albertanoniae TaxID=1266829 RepID=A0A4V6PA91_9ACTN|nr:hypothetical protein [Kribbella albertanoniae]TDC21105.1 hypothetical protein E1261_34110 [Kribbella albertanoniae]